MGGAEIRLCVIPPCSCASDVSVDWWIHIVETHSMPLMYFILYPSCIVVRPKDDEKSHPSEVIETFVNRDVNLTGKEFKAFVGLQSASQVLQSIENSLSGQHN